MNFQELHRCLAVHIANQVRNGQLTERGLARRAGVSQSHLHNVLKGKRSFSLHSADLIMRELGLGVMDLMRQGDAGGGFLP
jgi:transcriptional regulator with XRE-family HTH domain